MYIFMPPVRHDTMSILKWRIPGFNTECFLVLGWLCNEG